MNNIELAEHLLNEDRLLSIQAASKEAEQYEAAHRDQRRYGPAGRAETGPDRTDVCYTRAAQTDESVRKMRAELDGLEKIQWKDSMQIGGE